MERYFCSRVQSISFGKIYSKWSGSSKEWHPDLTPFGIEMILPIAIWLALRPFTIQSVCKKTNSGHPLASCLFAWSSFWEDKYQLFGEHPQKSKNLQKENTVLKEILTTPFNPFRKQISMCSLNYLEPETSIWMSVPRRWLIFTELEQSHDYVSNVKTVHSNIFIF